MSDGFRWQSAYCLQTSGPGHTGNLQVSEELPHFQAVQVAFVQKAWARVKVRRQIHKGDAVCDVYTDFPHTLSIYLSNLI
jgi:hypothetical protein